MNIRIFLLEYFPMAIVPTIALVFDIVVHFIGNNRNKKQATIDAYHILQNEVLEKLDKMTPKEVSESARNHKSIEYKNMEALIARIEHFCVGLNNGIYHKDVAYDICHGFFENRIWVRVFNFIGKEPTNKKDDLYDNIRKFHAYMIKKNKKRNLNEYNH